MQQQHLLFSIDCSDHRASDYCTEFSRCLGSETEHLNLLTRFISSSVLARSRHTLDRQSQDKTLEASLRLFTFHRMQTRLNDVVNRSSKDEAKQTSA